MFFLENAMKRTEAFSKVFLTANNADSHSQKTLFEAKIIIFLYRNFLPLSYFYSGKIFDGHLLARFERIHG